MADFPVGDSMADSPDEIIAHNGNDKDIVASPLLLCANGHSWSIPVEQHNHRDLLCPICGTPAKTGGDKAVARYVYDKPLTPQAFADICREQNLVPVELTPEQFIQTVSVSHDLHPACPPGEQLKVSWNRIAEGVVGLLLDAAYVAYRHYFHDRTENGQYVGRETPTGEAKIMLLLKDGRLQIITDPANDAVETLSVLMAAVWRYAELTTTPGEFNPVDAAVRALGFQID